MVLKKEKDKFKSFNISISFSKVAIYVKAEPMTVLISLEIKY